MQVPAQENFRKNLRSVLQREGLSQYELQRLSGVSRDHINKVLAGHVAPSLVYCEKLSGAVKIPLPIMLLDSQTFQRILESDVDKMRQGPLLAKELLPNKPTPPGSRKAKNKGMPEDIRLRNWVHQLAQHAG